MIGLFVTIVGTIIADLLLDFSEVQYKKIFDSIICVLRFPVPLWITLVLIIVGLFCLILLIRWSLNPKNAESWNEYRKAMIDGVLWRWGWDGRQIKNLASFCPECDLELRVVHGYSNSQHLYGHREEATFLYCERCPKNENKSIYDYTFYHQYDPKGKHKIFGPIEGAPSRLYESVKMEILRRVRKKYQLS